MVVVKIELWPGGDKELAQPLGGILIVNNTTGTVEIGHYDVNILHGGSYFGKEGFWKSGKCSFKRSLSPYHLVAKALAACGIK